MSRQYKVDLRGRSHLRAMPSGTGELPSRRALAHGVVGRLSRDELAHQDICAALLAARGLDARDIEVEMTDAGVSLRGTVATDHDRARALEIARRIAGALAVRDSLKLAERHAAGPLIELPWARRL